LPAAIVLTQNRILGWNRLSGELLVRRCMRKTLVLASAALLAAAAGGCSKQISGLREATEAGFQQPLNLFGTPDWARTSSGKVDLGPAGPVPFEDLVAADGQCALAPAEAPAAAAPAPAPPPAQPAAGAGNGTGFDGGLQSGSGGGPAAAPIVAGGIALGMTECQAVRRAGTPSNVSIGSGEGGERRVVLTYLAGPWPGIYTFSGGRLKVIDAAPVPEKPAAPTKKKKRVKHATNVPSAQHVYVR
jgi:hypothetical protein